MKMDIRKKMIFLTIIKEEIRDYPHLLFPKPMELDAWKECGKPYLWNVADSFQNIFLMQDCGYGKLALMVGDKIECLGKDFVNSQDMEFVGLDIEKPRLYRRINK